MFETAEMSRLTVASAVDKLEEVLRICADLGCVHIEEYGNFEDGIGVGKSIDSEESAKTSQLLTKARALQSEISAINADGPKSVAEVKKLVESMGAKIDDALANVDVVRDSETEISHLNERVKALERVAPLGIPLDLMAGFEGLELFIAETSKASKAHSEFSDIRSDIELQVCKRRCCCCMQAFRQRSGPNRTQFSRRKTNTNSIRRRVSSRNDCRSQIKY